MRKGDSYDSSGGQGLQDTALYNLRAQGGTTIKTHYIAFGDLRPMDLSGSFTCVNLPFLLWRLTLLSLGTSFN